VRGVRWLLVLLALAVLAAAQEDGEASGDEASGDGEASGDAEASADGEAEAPVEEAPEGEAVEASGDAAEDEAETEEGEEEEESGSGDEAAAAADEGTEGEEEEECETVETDGSGSGDGDDISDILALGGETKKCKPKAAKEEEEEGSGSDSGSGSGDEEMSGADALAAAVGSDTCDKEGMDEKVAECLGGLEGKVNELMTAIMGPEGGEGTLEDKITLVLVKKGVISCESEEQCDDDKQCLKQPDGMSRCQNPCERPEIIRCDVPFSECITEEHNPMCICKDEFHGNGTDVCIPVGFETEDNKRGYRMFDEEYVEWENATQKCQELGARLPVLSDAETIEIVKKYLDEAEFEVFEQWDRSSRRVWLGIQVEPGSGLVWADGQRIAAYPASSRLFVWESRRLLSQETAYADNTRHYGFYIDGDIAKLPGGGRKGAAVLCELLPDQLAQDPAQQQYQGQGYQPPQNYPPSNQYPSSNQGPQRYPGYPPRREDDGGYPNYPTGRR